MLCINTFCIFFKVEGEKVRRIIISDKEGPKFSAKFVDFQTTGLLTGDSLRKIPAIMNNMPPAALTAARLNASTRDTFILLGQLLSMAVGYDGAGDRRTNVNTVRLCSALAWWRGGRSEVAWAI